MSDCNWLSDGILVFVRTVKFHIFHDPLGEHICWYLYYIPMILIPVLGLAAAMFLGEKDGEKTVRKIIALLAFAVVLIISVFTNDLHQLVFRFSGRPPLSDRDYSYGILFIVIQGWIIFCLIWMEIILIRKAGFREESNFGCRLFREYCFWDGISGIYSVCL